MSDDHEEKTLRLLDILDRIAYLDEAESPAESLFSVDENGILTLSDALHTELSKPKNSDLYDWAHKHIVSLFE